MGTTKSEVNLFLSVGQVSASETTQVLRDFLRDHVREMVNGVTADEVIQLVSALDAQLEDTIFAILNTIRGCLSRAVFSL